MIASGHGSEQPDIGCAVIGGDAEDFLPPVGEKPPEVLGARRRSRVYQVGPELDVSGGKEVQEGTVGWFLSVGFVC